MPVGCVVVVVCAGRMCGRRSLCDESPLCYLDVCGDRCVYFNLILMKDIDRGGPACLKTGLLALGTALWLTSKLCYSREGLTSVLM